MKLTLRSLIAIILVAALTFFPTLSLTAMQINVSIKGGPLGFNLAGPANLAEVELTGLDQSTGGTLGTINVYDARGTGAGWTVIVQATGFSIDSTPTVTTVAGNTMPQAFMGPLDQPLQLLAADTDSGMGSYQTEPALRLNVPAETLAGTYETTVTLTITSAL